MATIATWYDVTFKDSSVLPTGDGSNLIQSENVIATGNTLDFGGVEAGTRSIIKCFKISFSKDIYNLRLWFVNNINSPSANGGVFDAGWVHGYHVRAKSTASPLINSNDGTAFNYNYYNDTPSTSGQTRTPFGLADSVETSGNYVNKNSFVYTPRDTSFFTNHAGYLQFGTTSTSNNFIGANNTTPYIYVILTPPANADGGARSNWGFRISFLYS